MAWRNVNCIHSVQLRERYLHFFFPFAETTIKVIRNKRSAWDRVQTLVFKHSPTRRKNLQVTYIQNKRDTFATEKAKAQKSTKPNQDYNGIRVQDKICRHKTKKHHRNLY